MKMDELTRTILSSSVAVAGAMKAREMIYDCLSSRSPRHTMDGHRLRSHNTMARSGNDIASLVIDSRGGSGTYVLCHGLGTSSNSLLLLGDLVHRRMSSQVIVYDRAGYRASRVGTSFPFTLQEAVDDLKDLIDDVAGKEPSVTLIGHSLGGLIAYRFTESFPKLVERLVLIEPTHPGEVRIAVQKRSGVLGISEMIRLNTHLTAFGSSVLEDGPGLDAKHLQNPYLPRVERELSTGRLWRAMSREWRTLEPMLVDGSSAVGPASRPVQVFSSDSALAGLTEQLDIFEDYLPIGQSVDVIAEADHHSIVLNLDRARNLVERMAI